MGTPWGLPAPCGLLLFGITVSILNHLLLLKFCVAKFSITAQDVASPHHHPERYLRTHQHSSDPPSLRHPSNGRIYLHRDIRLERGLGMAQSPSTFRLDFGLQQSPSLPRTQPQSSIFRTPGRSRLGRSQLRCHDVLGCLCGFCKSLTPRATVIVFGLLMLVQLLSRLQVNSGGGPLDATGSGLGDSQLVGSGEWGPYC